jgi:hypothetical protein
MNAKFLGNMPAGYVPGVCNHEANYYRDEEFGLTKREHTAIEMAKAMIGTASGPVLGGLDGAEHYTAQAAIRMADALLAELAKATS